MKIVVSNGSRKVLPLFIAYVWVLLSTEKKSDVQRFKCKDCNKTFNDLSLSPMANSKLMIGVWLNYEKCMVLGFSFRKSAKIVSVGVKTLFYMRHLILDAIKIYQRIGKVINIVDLDETFLSEFSKGNHRKSGFKMPRKARKRGTQID